MLNKNDKFLENDESYFWEKTICSSFCSLHRSRSVTAGSNEGRLYSQARVSGNNVPLLIHFDGSRHEDIFQQLVNDNASFY